jgi:predicted nucleic-acid-binding Zn-ribbon protein
MKDSFLCPKCGSKDVLGGIPLMDRGHHNAPAKLSAMIKTDASLLETLTFLNYYTFEIHAWICVTCGYTELYTTNTQELKKAFRRRQRSKKAKAADNLRSSA